MADDGAAVEKKGIEAKAETDGTGMRVRPARCALAVGHPWQLSEEANNRSDFCIIDKES